MNNPTPSSKGEKKIAEIIKLAKKLDKKIEEEGWSVDVHTWILSFVSQVKSL